MLPKAEMENGEWGMEKCKRKLKMGKLFFIFLFVCFRFAVYNEEQMVFLDIHVLFQKRSVAKFKEPN